MVCVEGTEKESEKITGGGGAGPVAVGATVAVGTTVMGGALVGVGDTLPGCMGTVAAGRRAHITPTPTTVAMPMKQNRMKIGAKG